MSLLQPDNKLPNLKMVPVVLLEEEKPVFEDVERFKEFEVDLKSELLQFSDTNLEGKDEIESCSSNSKQNGDDCIANCTRKLPIVSMHDDKVENKNLVTKHRKLEVKPHQAKAPNEVANDKKSMLEEVKVTKANRVNSKLDKIFHNLKACRRELMERRVPQILGDIDDYKYSKNTIRGLINIHFLDEVNRIISHGPKAFVLLGVQTYNRYGPMSDPKIVKVTQQCIIKGFLVPPSPSINNWEAREQANLYKMERARIAAPSPSINNFWEARERANLYKMERARIAAPRVCTSSQNILIMTCIGRKRMPAPTLKEAVLSEIEYNLAYNQIVDSMVRLYNNAKLIHCNLTEDNILWYLKQCYIIGVGQAISVSELEACKFLYRDCVNITRFFDSRGVKNVKRPYILFKKVSGCKNVKKAELVKMLKIIS